MATLTSSPPSVDTAPNWFVQFLKEELAPYPGRLALVFRMVAATTVVMILTMTFQMPYGAFGAIYAFTISRESPQLTISAVKTIVIAFVLGGAYILAGAIFFVNEPIIRFLWVNLSLFLAFYGLSVMSDYTAATRFGYLVVISIPLWDMHIPANQRVEGTLWVVGTVGFASIITLLMELAFAAFRPGDEITRAIAERLECVAASLADYGADRQTSEAAANNLARLSLVGTSRLRRILERSSRPPQSREHLAALVALAGRLIDIAASLEHVRVPLDDDNRTRVRVLAGRIADVRAALTSKTLPTQIGFESEITALRPAPFLHEMETVVWQMTAVVAGSPAGASYSLPSSREKSVSTLFVADALTNPEHIQFGLKGCLAASLSYVVYNALFWPEISTAVATCLLTALTTVGASHQIQALRFAGALIGGFGVGMLAQIFILPSLDSIAGFTVLFAAVFAVSAWIATSSTRLSYFGVQVALTFALINLTEFKIQTSLAVARDRVVGVLVGLAAMWLAFDPLWAAPTGVEMKRAFIACLRLLAQSAGEPISDDRQIAIPRISSLRESLNKQFAKVRALADGVLFEFGPTRQQDLALRNQIRQWQPQLRAFSVMRNTLLKYRLQLPGFELPPSVLDAQREFDEQLGRMLDSMADRLEGNEWDAREQFRHSFDQLQKAAQAAGSDGADTDTATHLASFLPLCRMTESLVLTVDREWV